MLLAIKRIICIIISMLHVYTAVNAVDGGFWQRVKEDSGRFVQTADVSLSLRPDKTYQTVAGFGASACWWAQDVGKSDNAETVAKALFGSEGLGLNIYRYNLGAGEKENPNSRISGNRATESFYVYNEDTGAWEYDFTRDAAAQRELELALSYGCVDTVVLFANSPHWSLTRTGQGTGGREEYFSNLPPENYRAFADYCVTVARYFISKGVPVKYLSPINEPQWSWGGGWVGQEGCHYEPNEILQLMRVFAKAIKESGLPVKLMAPESGNISDDTTDWFAMLANDPEVSPVLGSLAYHSYWSDGNAYRKYTFGQALAEKNYPYTVDMTEWCELPLEHDIADFGGAVRTASVINQDLMLSGVNSWSAWTGVNNYGVHEDGSLWSDGLLAMNDDASDVRVAQRYWALAHFSRFIPAGSVRIDASADVADVNYLIGWDGAVYDAQMGFSASAFRTTEGRYVAVIVNEGAERTFTVTAPLCFRAEVWQSTAEKQMEKRAGGLFGNVFNVPENSITTVVLY